MQDLQITLFADTNISDICYVYVNNKSHKKTFAFLIYILETWALDNFKVKWVAWAYDGELLVILTTGSKLCPAEKYRMSIGKVFMAGGFE